MKTSGRSFAAFINASVFVALNSIAAQPQAKPDTAVGKLDVDGHFSPSEGKISTKDLSGIACMEPSGDKARHCVVVNDENRTAQLVTIINKKIIVGAEVALSREAPSNATLGAQPVVECPKGKGGFKEFDGEGVAYAAPYFYVTGSHGCSRKSGKFRLSSFLLARFRLSPEAWSVVEKRKLKVSSRELIAPVETTYRLSDAVRNQAALSDFFGKDLMNGNGLNIEGIAVINGKLFAGLRAPSQDGNAYLVSAPLKELFAPGRAPMALGSEVIPLALGKDVGIRDLASLSNGNLLVLAGPAQEQKNIRYAFFEAEPRAHGKVKALEKISNMNKGAKAEAVTVLNHGSRTMHVLVLFDGEENGAPTEYIIRKTDN
jgi:hypothetical protein